MGFKIEKIFVWAAAFFFCIALILAALLGWAGYKIEKQKGQIKDLQTKLEAIANAGQQTPPEWVNPFGNNFVPATPTQTPSEQNYNGNVVTYKKELEKLNNEEIFSKYAFDVANGGPSPELSRDVVVQRYSGALADSISRRIAEFRSSNN